MPEEHRIGAQRVIGLCRDIACRLPDKEGIKIARKIDECLPETERKYQ